MTTPNPGLPQLVVGSMSFDRLCAMVMAVLINLPPERRLFVQGERLVTVKQRDTGEPYVQEVDRRQLVTLLAGAVDFITLKGKGAVNHVPPPSAVVDAILGAGQWPFARLLGVSRVPLLRPDGQLAATVGFDASTGFFVDVDPPVGVAIDRFAEEADELKAARSRIEEILADFPFDDAASKANAIAFMVTPYLRAVIDGPIPLGVIRATQPGVGKTLLGQAIAMVGTGEEPSVVTEPETDQEFRKKITAHLRFGSAFALFDNLSRQLTSDSLAALLTSRTWKDRILGRSLNVTLPNTSLWIVTGNRLVIGGDLPRRSVLIGLRSEEARSWARTGFRIPDLLEFIRERRHELQAACATLCLEWARSGMKPAVVPVMGSFESWTSVVGSVLKHAGIDGFLENRDVLQLDGDTAPREFERFLRAVAEVFPSEFRAREVLTAVRDCKIEPEVVPEEMGTLSGAGASRQIGKALSRWEGRPLADDGIRLERVSIESRSRAVVWRIATRLNGAPTTPNPRSLPVTV